MCREYELIARKSYLRVKRGNLYSMANDIKSSNQFRYACLKKIKIIDKEIEQITNDLINYRKVKYLI